MTSEADAPPVAIHTVGHSSHSAEAFLTLLRSHDIRQIADVRLIPKSRRHPQFSDRELPAWLSDSGISYRHFRDLGGRRRPVRNSVNTGWQVEAFRGYADYMQTPTFEAAISALLAFAGQGRTAVMCAEAVWWQCHRRLLADFLTVRGIPILHVLPSGPAKPHELSEFARVGATGVTYPGLL
jgi:uncharacterized protein (DUF488 family)